MDISLSSLVSSSVKPFTVTSIWGSSVGKSDQKVAIAQVESKKATCKVFESTYPTIYFDCKLDINVYIIKYILISKKIIKIWTQLYF